MTEARRREVDGVVVCAYVAAESVGRVLHALEYQPEVEVLTRTVEPAMNRERWKIRSDRFPRCWMGNEVRPVFSVMAGNTPQRVDWLPVPPGARTVPHPALRFPGPDTPRPTAADRYHAEALYRWGWHLARFSMMLPVTAATTAVAWAGYVAAQARGDVFIAIMPSAFGLAGVAALVLYAARRPR